MNELQSLSLQLTKLKETGQTKVPIVLQTQIISAIENSNLSVKEAANVLNLHHMTFYKWRHKLKKNAVILTKASQVKAVRKYKKRCKQNHVQKQDDFLELLSPQLSQAIATSPSKTINQLFLEINLGHGASVRIYR
jgi:IS30 family transposase